MQTNWYGMGFSDLKLHDFVLQHAQGITMVPSSDIEWLELEWILAMVFIPKNLCPSERVVTFVSQLAVNGFFWDEHLQQPAILVWKPIAFIDSNAWLSMVRNQGNSPTKYGLTWYSTSILGFWNYHWDYQDGQDIVHLQPRLQGY